MYLKNSHTALYTAFDVFPSSKGAATHIAHFTETLFSWQGNGWLHTLGDGEMLTYQDGENNIEITRFQEEIPNFLERTTVYGEQLYETLQQYNETLLKDLRICHFRDIWSGLPIIAHQNHTNTQIKTVFEVNSLPSVELPYRYAMSASTLEKIKSLEKFCLTEADQIVVPSEVIRKFLLQKGVATSKIQLIYNGANIPQQLPKTIVTPQNYIMYFGALQSWQGIETLFRAFALLRDKEDLQLVLCVSLKEKFSRPLKRLAEKLQIAEKLTWQYRLSKDELQEWISGAKLTVAPLTECSRNLEQGCCPLKILESMACGVPVIASDLPVTRELISQNQNGKLVRADRPSDLARTIRILLEEDDFRQKLGREAQKTISDKFTWKTQQEILLAMYQKLV